MLGSRISSSFAELKGHEHIAKAVTVDIIWSPLLVSYDDEDLKSDYLNMEMALK